jgi:hypothetical protein
MSFLRETGVSLQDSDFSQPCCKPKIQAVYQVVLQVVEPREVPASFPFHYTCWQSLFGKRTVSVEIGFPPSSILAFRSEDDLADISPTSTSNLNTRRSGNKQWPKVFAGIGQVSPDELEAWATGTDVNRSA